MKTEPEGKSKVVDWERRGWTSRTLGSERFGEEKIEIVAFWKTGAGLPTPLQWISKPGCLAHNVVSHSPTLLLNNLA